MTRLEAETSREKQRQIIEYISSHKEAHNGIPPTVRQVCDEIGTPSTSVAAYHLKRLAEKGLLVKRCGHYDLAWGRWSK